MSEPLSFQEFGLRKTLPHLIDPFVAIQIEEAIANNGEGEVVSGVLFGRQNANNLSVTSVLVTSIGELTADDEFVRQDGLDALVQYHEKVHSTKCVGLFSVKTDFDRECYAQFSSGFRFKSTADFIFLTVDFDREAAVFDYKAFSSLRNKFFRDVFVAISAVAFRFGFAEEEFDKSGLTSDAGHILRHPRQGGEPG